MKVTLVVVDGKPLGLEIPLKGAKFSIGRDSRCNLRPNSDLVSKLHCLIEVVDEQVLVRDLGSTNGTFVNDQQIEFTTSVKHGDKIRVGSLTFEARIVFDRPQPLTDGDNGHAKSASEDPLQWLLSDDSGKLLESSSNTTVIDLPVAATDETVTEATPPAVEEIPEVVAEQAKPKGPQKAKMYRPPQAAALPADKQNAQDAAGDILSRYFVRRRPG